MTDGADLAEGGPHMQRIDKLFVAAAVAVAAALMGLVVLGRLGQPELTYITSGMIVAGTMFNLWRGHL